MSGTDIPSGTIRPFACYAMSAYARAKPCPVLLYPVLQHPVLSWGTPALRPRCAMRSEEPGCCYLWVETVPFMAAAVPFVLALCRVWCKCIPFSSVVLPFVAAVQNETTVLFSASISLSSASISRSGCD
eukprot:3330426-Rhodomonas_salina.3